METSDLVMILAVLSGPIIAVQLTRYLDEQKEVRQRKLWIFKTLMATRATSLSPFHVEALNRIDLEFNPKDTGEKSVLDAWKAYLDLLNDDKMPQDQWFIRRLDMLVDLLSKMAAVLDYRFDKTTIKNSSYFPKGHGVAEEELQQIRAGVKDLLSGSRSISVTLTTPPTELPTPAANLQPPQ